MTDNARIDEGKLIERLQVFADNLTRGSDWTGALLAAYNPTGSTAIPYERARAFLASDIVDALARRSIQEQPEAVAGAGWKVEASGLAVATIQADDFSLIELTRREGGGFNLTIHAGDEESGRWDDLSIGLSTSRTAELVGYLAPDNTDARGAQVKALEWEVDHVGGGLRAGEYRLRAGLWTHGYYWLRGEEEPHTGYPDEDDAKAAAQADYVSRILAAIIPGTDASGVIEQLREALKPFAVAADEINAATSDKAVAMNWAGEHQITMGDIRRARAALDPVKAPKP